jgi:hypothetical protein
VPAVSIAIAANQPANGPGRDFLYCRFCRWRLFRATIPASIKPLEITTNAPTARNRRDLIGLRVKSEISFHDKKTQWALMPNDVPGLPPGL